MNCEKLLLAANTISRLVVGGLFRKAIKERQIYELRRSTRLNEWTKEFTLNLEERPTRQRPVASKLSQINALTRNLSTLQKPLPHFF